MLRTNEMNVAVENDKKEGDFPRRLQALGIARLTEWDALEFLYHHPATLCSSAQIAQFIGHDKVETGAVLQKLEALGLIQRSRVSAGVRFYLFAMPSEPSRHSCLVELMSMENRTRRLLLLKHLKYPPHGARRRRDGGISLA
jgi:DNA-binding MarR family transcriptional regulator